jgi:hypothetical protein
MHEGRSQLDQAILSIAHRYSKTGSALELALAAGREWNWESSRFETERRAGVQ